MRKILFTAGVFMAVLCFVFTFGIIDAFAEDTTNSEIGSTISDWVLDEENGYIYAVSNEDSKLLFISTDTLQVTKTIALDSNPTDIDLYDGSIYIPLKDIKTIVAVDAATQAVTDTYTTEYYPIRTDVQGSALFYTSRDSINNYEQHCSLNVLDMTERTEQKLSGTYYRPDIVVDRTNDVLYIGESKTSSGDIAAISTADYSEISSSASAAVTHEYFVYPVRKVLVDDENVYYSKTALDPDNVAIKNGEFGESIYCIYGGYVFSDTAVYDRDTYLKITDLPFTTTLILMDGAKPLKKRCFHAEMGRNRRWENKAERR